MTASSRFPSRFFETFSFLPPVGPGDRPPGAVPPQQRLDSLHRVRVRREGVCDSHGWTGIDYNVNAGYYDNRYWVMWKLPMYGCTNPEEVLQEVRSCTRSFPSASSVAGFDNIKQVQCSSSWPTAPPTTAPSRPSTAARLVATPPWAAAAATVPPRPPPPQQQNYSW